MCVCVCASCSEYMQFLNIKAVCMSLGQNLGDTVTKIFLLTFFSL